MIYLTLKDRKQISSIWLGDISDFRFTKISDGILGYDPDAASTSLSIRRIDYFIHVLNKLPGLIHVTQVAQFYPRGMEQDTLISFDNGNTYLRLKYVKNGRYANG
ncbi:hypothetical protein RF11_08741 [Thelohanellus kitauei]|uniref:Uncharacterized protein n=1 Tax=Thelohanellus kitauei TaxID=669202 RepID=A0A0C2MNZ1_THEKT|nr:hypothetical protein RF11_08741 [Thelohanellus kitauei]